MVEEKHRGNGYGKKTWETAWKTLDQSTNIGLEALAHMISKYETLGLHVVWETSIAFLNFQKINEKLSGANIPAGVSIVPIKTIDKEKVCEYDASVFGTSRRVMIEKWLEIPGSLGWAAVDGKRNVVGYNVIRQTIIGKGTEFALSMAPLFADNNEIARALLKVAAEECQANQAIPVTNFEMLYTVGGESGPQSAQLVADVDGTTTPFCTRMYTKGIPYGRQVDKIYGIINPAFD